MPQPRLTDDGSTVTLDLHGASVDEAMRLVQRTASLAAARGRATLRVVHGTSTSDPRAGNRTIKHALYALLDEGALGAAVHDFRGDGSTLIGLRLGARRDPTPIRLLDLTR